MTKKVVCYAICKNDRSFVDDWWKSVSEADAVYVLDTGSTDGSAERLQELGANVTRQTIDPWRFDEARNAAMALIPEDADICVSTDIDERFDPGWRAKLVEAWESVYNCNQALYTYVYCQADLDGKKRDGLVFTYKNIHARRGFYWECPCHECLSSKVPSIPCSAQITLRHAWTKKERRSNYLELLKVGAAEKPNDSRRRAYLAREYMLTGNITRAIYEYHKAIELSGQFGWHEEKGLSLLNLAKCYAHNENFDLAEYYGLRSLAEMKGREPLVLLARIYYDQKRWWECRYYAERALQIPYNDFYGSDPECYSSYPNLMACIANYNLGERERAREHARICLKADPSNEKYRINARYFGVSLDSPETSETPPAVTPRVKTPPTALEDTDPAALVLAMACTDNWVELLCVSLFTHLSANKVARVYTYTDGDTAPIRRLCDAFGAEYVNFPLGESLNYYISKDSPNINPMCSKATLARLFLPFDCPNEKKMLYLDADTVSHESYSDIWNLDLSGFAVAGGRDIAQIRDYPHELKIMSPGGQPNPVNAGVLLMNLDFIREYRIGEKWLHLINTVNFRLDDQDAINTAVGPYRLIFPPKYNSSASCGYVEDPVLTHFSAIGDFWKNERWPVCKIWRAAAAAYREWCDKN